MQRKDDNMTKDEIRKLMDQQQRVADRNYLNYQDSGISRYDRAQQRAENIVWLCEQALGSADEHQELINLKAEFNGIGADAIRLSHEWNENEAFALIKNMAAIARMNGIWDPYKDK